MKKPTKTQLLTLVFVIFSSPSGIAGQDFAQPSQETKPPASIPLIVRPRIKIARTDTHRFWDRTNKWLFAGVAASRTLDYFSTLNMRRRGNQEFLLTNETVDNHPAFAVIEAVGTGVSMGASYLFHRYGHHKLERWTSIVHIGLATSGAASNYSLKTVHSLPISVR